MTTDETLQAMRELDGRVTGGTHVRLLWSEHGGLTVSVADAQRGDAFEIDVQAGEDPVDVFNHPYAYAAWRRIETAPAPPEPPRFGLITPLVVPA